MNQNEEFVLKAIGRLALEFNYTWEQQRKARDCLYYALANYNVVAIQNALVASDISDRILMYVQVKRMEGYSDITLKNYLYTLKKFASSVNKNVNLITKNDIRCFIMNYSKGKKPSTQNSITYYIKGFFSWLEQEELIDKNPARKLSVNKLPKRLRKSLTIQELEKVRIACEDERERALVEFFSSTGCRVSEVVGLNISDLDINSNSARVIGKGDKERIIFFNDKTKLYLEKYLLTRTDNNAALFVSIRYPFSRLGRRGIETIINAIGKRAELNKSIYPHLLRHTMATLGYKAGADITTIQHLLGHTSPVTTQIYAEQSLDNLKHQYNQNVIH